MMALGIRGDILPLLGWESLLKLIPALCWTQKYFQNYAMPVLVLQISLKKKILSKEYYEKKNETPQRFFKLQQISMKLLEIWKQQELLQYGRDL